MFQFGFTEIFVIAVIAILFVAPKDLPGLMRTVGQTVGKVRRTAREFQRQLDDAVRDDELDALRKDVANIGRDTDAEIRRGMYGRSPAAPSDGETDSAVDKPLMAPIAPPLTETDAPAPAPAAASSTPAADPAPAAPDPADHAAAAAKP